MKLLQNYINGAAVSTQHGLSTSKRDEWRCFAGSPCAALMAARTRCCVQLFTRLPLAPSTDKYLCWWVRSGGIAHGIQLSVEMFLVLKLCSPRNAAVSVKMWLIHTVKSALSTAAALKLAHVSLLQQPFYCGYAARVLATDCWNLLWKYQCLFYLQISFGAAAASAPRGGRRLGSKERLPCPDRCRVRNTDRKRRFWPRVILRAHLLALFSHVCT